MKYAFIRAHSEDYPVNLQCRMLAVQRSAYYAWCERPGKVIEPEELALRRRMKALFSVSRSSLSSRMMMRKLREEEFDIGRAGPPLDENLRAGGQGKAQIQSDQAQQALLAGSRERAESCIFPAGTQPGVGH